MKLTKIKNLFTIGILLLCISIFFINCNNDNLEHQDHLHESEQGVVNDGLKRLTMEQLFKDDVDFNRLSKKYLSGKIGESGIHGKGADQNIEITSDTINVIERDDYTSYTIRVKRKDKQYDTENLIIENDNGKESAFILSYEFDGGWLADHLNGKGTPPSGRVFYTEYGDSNLSSKSGGCSIMYITITSPCGCGHYYISSCNGCNIRSPRYPSTYQTSVSVCDDVGGGDDGSGAPFTTDHGDEGGLGGSGSGGNPSTGDGSSSQTQANLEDMAEFIEFKVNKVIVQAELNSSQVNWIRSNVDEALALYDFLNINRWSQDSKNMVNDIVSAFMDRSILSALPFVKYPKSKSNEYRRNYPKLTEYLKNQLPKVANNIAITRAFKKYTNMTDAQVKETFNWGEGPEIVIKQLGNNIYGEEVVGRFSEPNTLELDLDMINLLENSSPRSTFAESILFFVAVTVLHEAVHYGDFTYNNDYWNVNINGEEGWLFEEEVYGGSIRISPNGKIEIIPLN